MSWEVTKVFLELVTELLTAGAILALIIVVLVTDRSTRNQFPPSDISVRWRVLGGNIRKHIAAEVHRRGAGNGEADLTKVRHDVILGTKQKTVRDGSAHTFSPARKWRSRGSCSQCSTRRDPRMKDLFSAV